MAVLFQLALLAVPEVERVWGRDAVLPTALLLGVSDMDALLVAMVDLGRRSGDPALAALGLTVGLLGSACFKAGIALVVGGRGYRWLAGGGSLLLALVVAFSLWIAGP
jgi:hypothetical protein